MRQEKGRNFRFALVYIIRITIIVADLSFIRESLGDLIQTVTAADGISARAGKKKPGYSPGL